MSLPQRKTNAALGIAKVTPPKLCDAVPRTALLRRLEKAKDRRLIYIKGQAAQGKSTLAASYAEKQKDPVAWLNLGPEDSDAATLFYGIAYAFTRLNHHKYIPAVAEQPANTMILRSEIPLYRGWSVSLFSLAPSPVLLVLDGLDRLDSDSSALSFLKVLIDEAPPGFRLMLLSRTLALSRITELETAGAALLLDNDDLAFSESEARSLFKRRYPADIGKCDIAQIHKASEGWVGGLVIFGETISKLPKGQHKLEIPGNSSRDFRRQIFQYFSDNIFASLPPDISNLLLKTSIFETIEPGFVMELTREEQAESVLMNLFERSMFTTAHYDEKGRVIYRYHKLFRDFLSQKMAAKFSAAAVKALHLRAGQLHQKRDELEQALTCYIKAKAYSQASAIIKLLGSRIVQQGRHRDLSRWLESMPGELVQTDPWLLLFLCWSRRLSGFFENLADLPKVLREFRAAGETDGVLYCLSFLIESLLVSGQAWDVVKPILDDAEAVLMQSRSQSFPYEKALLYYQLGSMHTLRGDPRKGYWAGREALLIAKALDDQTLLLRIYPFVLTALSYLGDYAECDKLIEKVEPLVKECRHPELTAKYLLSKTMYLVFAGDQEKAPAETREFVRLVEQNGLLIFSSAAFLNRLLCSAFFENFAEMDRQLKFLPSICRQTINPFLEAVLMSTAGNGLYRKGDLASALDHLDKAIEHFSAQPGDSEFHLHNAMIVRSMARLGLDENAQCGAELDRAAAYFQDIGNRQSLAEALLAKALMHLRQGAVRQAAELFDTGLLMASRCAHWHFLRISRKDAAEICLHARELASGQAADYAAHLLTGPLGEYLAREKLAALADTRQTK